MHLIRCSLIILLVLGVVLEADPAVPVGEVAGDELRTDGLLEDLPHVFRGDVEALLNLAGLDVLLLHLLVVLADVGEADLLAVEQTVLADLPEGDGGDGVDAHVQLPRVHDAFAHLDHGLLLVVADASPPADADDHVFGAHDGDEVDLEFEGDVHLLDEVLPVAQGQADHLADVELLEVVLLLEAGRVDRVPCHVFYGEDVFVLLFAVLLLVFLFTLLPALLTLRHRHPQPFPLRLSPQRFPLAPLPLDLLRQNDANNRQKPCGGHVNHILRKFEDEAAVDDDLAALAEVLVEVGLLVELDASAVEGAGVQHCEAVLLAVFALVVHHVVVVADGVQVHEGALADAAHARAVVEAD